MSYGKSDRFTSSVTSSCNVTSLAIDDLTFRDAHLITGKGSRPNTLTVLMVVMVRFPGWPPVASREKTVRFGAEGR